MKCLVTGAYGFIGRDVVAALQSEGVSVVGAGRDLALGRRILPDIEWIACDFNRDVEVAASASPSFSSWPTATAIRRRLRRRCERW
jgi:nucleoside-diphosphate-sugar epimerase